MLLAKLARLRGMLLCGIVYDACLTTSLGENGAKRDLKLRLARREWTRPWQL